MDLNRNHYYTIGIVLFLLGIQFRYVSSFELNEKSSSFIEKRLGAPADVQPQPFSLFGGATPISNRRVVRPPRWLGWSLMSLGGVLFVFSLSMKKPGT